MRMPFGKHAGRDISDLPTSYLEWCMKTLKDIDKDLLWALSGEYFKRCVRQAGRERERAGATPPTANLPIAVSVDLALEIVKAGRRALALQLHPDRGGDGEKMVRANATADYLEKRLPSLLAGRN